MKSGALEHEDDLGFQRFCVLVFERSHFVLRGIIHLRSNTEECGSECLNVGSGARICLGVRLGISTLNQLHEIKQLWYHFTNNDIFLIFSGLGRTVHLHNELTTALSHAQILQQTAQLRGQRMLTHFARYSSLSKLALLVLSEQQHLETSRFQPLGYF